MLPEPSGVVVKASTSQKTGLHDTDSAELEKARKQLAALKKNLA